MQKNVAGQYIILFAFDSATSQAKTGDAANMLFYVTKDNGTTTLIASNSGVPTEQSSTHAKGWYIIALAQAETNADLLTFTGVSVTSGIQVVGCSLATDPPSFNALAISGGIVSADVKKTDGVTYHAYDGTLAAVTAATDITFPTTDALGNAIPDDARYAFCVFKLVGGTGAGQLLLTGAKTGTRKFAFLSAVTPVDPSTDTTYALVSSWKTNVTHLLNTAWLTPGVAGTPDVNTKLVGGQTASASGTVTFPNATLASTTNITAGTITTVTTTTTATNVTTVNGLASGVITATSIAADAITAAKIADGAIDRATFTADTGLQSIRSNTAAGGASATITLDSGASATNSYYNNCLVYVTGNTGVGQVRRIRSYVGSSKVATITPAWTTNPDNTSTFAIIPVASAWDEVTGDHVASGTTGASLNAAGSAGDPWTTVLPGAYGATTAGFILGTNLDALITSRLAPTVSGRTLDVSSGGEAGLDWANVGTPGATVGLSATTMSAVTTVATATNVTTVNGLANNVITAAAMATDGTVKIAGAVWDLATVGHTTSGTFGAAMNAAGSAGDPWSTSLPGAYGAGSAGFIVGTNINALITSRMATYSQPTGFLAATFPATVASTTNITAASGVALTSSYDFAKGTVGVTESYAANGAAPSPVQALLAIHQYLMDFVITGTSYTAKKLDNSTTAFVVTLNDGTSPTGAART